MESGRVDLFLGMDERLHTPPQRSRLGETGFLDLYSTLFWLQLLYIIINSLSTNQLHAYLQHPPIRWPTRTVAGSLEPESQLFGDTQLCLFPNTSVDPVGPLSSTVPGRWQQIAALIILRVQAGSREGVGCERECRSHFFRAPAFLTRVCVRHDSTQTHTAEVHFQLRVRSPTSKALHRCLLAGQMFRNAEVLTTGRLN